MKIKRFCRSCWQSAIGGFHRRFVRTALQCDGAPVRTLTPGKNHLTAANRPRIRTTSSKSQQSVMNDILPVFQHLITMNTNQNSLFVAAPRAKNTILSTGRLSQPTSQCQWHQADRIFDINAVSWLRLRTACVARLLPLLILLSLLTLPASLQAQGSPYTRYTYTTKNGTITITGCKPLDDNSGDDSWVVVIPSTINGTPVTCIGDGVFSSYSITSVTIPNSVTSIGDSAFSGSSLSAITVNADNLFYSSVDGVLFNKSQTTLIQFPSSKSESGMPTQYYAIPNSVTSIRDQAFSGCSLADVTIPRNVASIGNSAFSGCSSLNAITVDANNPFYSSLDGVLFNKSKTTLIQFPGGKSGSYTIPNSVTSIGDGAFSNNFSSLSAITVDANNPFYSSLDGVLFNKNKTTLIQCPRGKSGSYTIPSSVTSIGDGAFSGCYLDVTIPNSVTSIGNSAFYGCNLTSVTIPNSVTSIGDSAFSGCSYTVDALNPSYSSLDGVLFNQNKTTLIQCPRGKSGSYTIPSSVTSIGDSAFSSCSLTSVTIPSSVTSIGNLAFLCCSLTNVTIPNRVSSIGDWTFHGCYSLSSITIGNSVTSIGDSAFSECSLTSVTIPNSVSSIGNSAFSSCSSLTNITIPSSVNRIGNSAFYGCTKLTRVTIPNSVISIGDLAFYGCSTLTSVTIPSQITSIGDGTFSGCYSLSSITIGNCVTNIGGGAFSDCSSLVSVTIGNSVVSLGDYSFDSCIRLSRLTIGSSVANIGNSAFSDCSNLINVTIPYSVTNIGQSAFWVTV